VTRDRRLAAVLAGVAGVLVLLAAAQRFGLGSGYRLANEDADSGPGRAAVAGNIQTEPYKLRPWVEYGELVARPLFSDTRAPEPVEATAEAGAAEAQPLNVTLTGVILSGSLRLAMVKDNQSGETQRVRLGQPLGGPQAGWVLQELKPRGAVFDGAAMGKQELELVVDTAGSPAPLQQVASAPTPTPGLAPGATPQPAAPPTSASAEDIRRRIEERRKQLREEAQRMMEQQQGQN
jgi:general secretion pathway protein N